MWVAKNKGERARPSLFYHKPSRLNDHEWYAHGSDYGYPLYDEHQFDSLTWEDEPIEIKLVPSGLDVIEMPSEEEVYNSCEQYIEQDNESRYGGCLNKDHYFEGWLACIDWLKSKIK